MNRFDFKKMIPHLMAILIMVVITFTYLNPLLEGKRLLQSDIVQWTGMSKEVVDFREKTGDEALWTNSMFGGMPAYQISVEHNSNYITFFDEILMLGLPRPANLIFLYFIGFYILLISLRVNPWLAIAGSLAFAFSSYFLIILEAGHNSKAHAIGYMAPVLAGIIMAYRGKLVLGSLLTALFLTLEVSANHLQITYYLLLMVVLLGVFMLVDAYKEKKLNSFIKTTGFLAIAALFAVLANLSNLWTTWEYGKETIRGKTELTTEQQNRTSGLDKDYATQWSYGIDETFTLLIPNVKGGATGALGNNEKALNEIDPKYVSTVAQQNHYWGDQPFTSGPVYVGAIVMFFFILGLFVTRGNLRWWLLSITILSILLAWGKNFMPLTDLFLHYVPGYNKFRAVSMILVIANLAIPLLAVMGIKEVMENREVLSSNKKPLYISLGLTAGLALLFYMLPDTFFSFLSNAEAAAIDQQRQSLESNQQQGFEQLVSNIMAARINIFRADTMRSFLLILAGATMLFAYVKLKFPKGYFYSALIVLILIDMIPVGSRYLNKDNFKNRTAVTNPYQPTEADKLILKDPDPNFRVMNVAVSTFQDASTSFFHKSIGGYHGAKLRRYQELIDHHIVKTNMNVLNMLNTKYFIVPDENRRPQMQVNFEALGNAWFVNDIEVVDNADSELDALTNFDPSSTAIVDKRFGDFIQNFNPVKDTAASIALSSYAPNHLKYTSHSAVDQLAVFSEIYYDKGWEAFIDGKPAQYFRANYVLRAMIVPSGSHEIEFLFKPTSYYTGSLISSISSIILILLLAGYVIAQIRSDKAAIK